ncbi:LuxR C-terminal-related transcriptional regulator [Paraburkholderia aromaticivorans]|uniref:LuxR family transcriptional regulator n=1 Tax=Paraburkholderia aromaticivorans TaxID=2026199 RepID=A0A248VS94_9BURK|nr:LuxR C-terminal-related transcriptional regulator [Paraburkholderia aromaticivorans]ASW01908.1 LuxR family transcriptional regulator [Paraburkholderia aromaticivorans]
MSTTSFGSESATTEIVLKTIPPRAPLHLLARSRLSAVGPSFNHQPLVLVQAPAGFGKTSLLAQWRREHLTAGATVAWLLADERDDADHLLPGLVHAMRTACARPDFGRLLLEGAPAVAGGLDGATAWLAEVARLSLDVVLFIDDADRMPADGAEVLAYVLHNAPPNLRIVVAARSGLEVAFGDLLAYGQAMLVGPEVLRFRLDETIALIGNRFGPRIDADACARLFEATDGWPLGLQLALAAMAHAADPRQTVDALATGPGRARDQLVGALLTKLSPEDEAFLTRISVVDMLHPDLCAALTGDAGAPERLLGLVRQTPVFITSEDGPWCRLHMLVRDVLRERLLALDAGAQTTLHTRATTWLAAHGMLQEAAYHALAAGQYQTAYELADRWLHDAVKQGHLATVLDWLDRLPESELERRPRLRLAAAWALALGQRHKEARCQVERVLAAPGVDTELRYECALILSAAAYYADEPDRFVELFEPWADHPPDGASWLAQVHANRLSARSVLFGEPAQARRFQQRVPRGQVGKGHGYLARWGDHIVALSYLREGQLRLAEEVVMPALTSAEADLGRRHPLTCMFAAIGAALSYEADRIDEAAALLANRLDVLERAGTPETVILAYCTAARVAGVRGSEHRALDLLEALHAMGLARRLPRLRIVSVAEQVRIHASRYRAQTCDALVRSIDEILADAAIPQGPLWRGSVALLRLFAGARADLAARRNDSALHTLTEAAELAQTQKLGVPRIELMALRAFALEQTGANGLPLLREAMNLAQTYDLTRTLADAHPALADWARRVSAEQTDSPETAHAIAVPRIARPPALRGTANPRAVPSVVLTPKEREILELLARNLSNKEIATAATVGEGTVKWHLKNLFGKLDASSRKHAVRRALVLGLLEEA